MNWKQLPQTEDLSVFLSVVKNGSFVSAAHDLGMSPAYVSKRIQVLESSLNTKLFHRTTRSIALTDDGQCTADWSAKVLANIDELFSNLSDAKANPAGRLMICSTFGFGRVHVGPALTKLVEQYPELDVRLELYDRAVDIVHEGFDLEIRVGDDLPEHHVAKMLVANHRILCASPCYIAENGVPETLEQLRTHQCLAIRERGINYGTWCLEDLNGEKHTVKVDGTLSSNNGEVLVNWALDGKGILLRSYWDVREKIKAGDLVHILSDYSQSANVWAIYPTKSSQSAKMRLSLDFLRQHFETEIRDQRSDKVSSESKHIL